MGMGDFTGKHLRLYVDVQKAFIIEASKYKTVIDQITISFRPQILVDKGTSLDFCILPEGLKRNDWRLKGPICAAPPSCQSMPNFLRSCPARSFALLPLKLSRIAIDSWPKVGCGFLMTAVCGS
jgi:hypothetical protein